MLTSYASQMIKRSILMGEPLPISKGMFFGLLKHMVDHTRRGPVEVEYLNYQRQHLVFNDVTARETFNANQIHMAVPPANFGSETVMDFGIYDAEKGGNCWFTGRFEKEGYPHAVVLTNQSPIVLLPGSVAISFE